MLKGLRRIHLPRCRQSPFLTINRPRSGYRQADESSDIMPRSFHVFDLMFLGSGGSSPSRFRGSPCSLLSLGGDNFMFDAGEGSLRQLINAPYSAAETSRIFITHLHADHILGLPSLILQNAIAPGSLNIYGPQGLYDFLVTTLNMTHASVTREIIVNEMVITDKDYVEFEKNSVRKIPINWSMQSIRNREGAGKGTKPNKSINIHRNELHSDGTGSWKCVTGSMSVQARLIKHRVPCFGYIAQEKAVAGKLDVKKCDSFGVPVEHRRLFKEGKSYNAKYMDENGVRQERLVTMEDVCEEPMAGRRLVYLGDTSDPSNMGSAAFDADLLVHEATAGNEFHDTLVARGHSTSRMAASSALAMNAKRLVINHVGSQYMALNTPASVPKLKTDTDIQREARQTLGRPEHCFVARDFVTVSVPPGGYSKANKKFLVKFPYVNVNSGTIATKGESVEVTELPLNPPRGPHAYTAINADRENRPGHGGGRGGHRNKIRGSR